MQPTKVYSRSLTVQQWGDMQLAFRDQLVPRIRKIQGSRVRYPMSCSHPRKTSLAGTIRAVNPIATRTELMLFIGMSAYSCRLGVCRHSHMHLVQHLTKPDDETRPPYASWSAKRPQTASHAFHCDSAQVLCLLRSWSPEATTGNLYQSGTIYHRSLSNLRFWWWLLLLGFWSRSHSWLQVP